MRLDSSEQVTKGAVVSREIEIRTVRTIDNAGVMREGCNDGLNCAGLHALPDRPGRDYWVLKRVTDPAEVAALSALAADDEVFGWAPTRLRTGEA